MSDNQTIGFRAGFAKFFLPLHFQITDKMKHRINLLCIALMMLVLGARADEGMWLPYSINGQNLADMQRLGCKLTAEQIFSFNQPSLKDAIVQFGGGCTGELISPEGLLLTNHHCGLSYVQAHASVEHDYLQDGFWARSKDEELPNEGLTVSFLSYIEDVTAIVLKGVTDNMSEDERAKKIEENGKMLASERKGKRDVTVEIVPSTTVTSTSCLSTTCIRMCAS